MRRVDGGGPSPLVVVGVGDHAVAAVVQGGGLRLTGSEEAVVDVVGDGVAAAACSDSEVMNGYVLRSGSKVYVYRASGVCSFLAFVQPMSHTRASRPSASYSWELIRPFSSVEVFGVPQYGFASMELSQPSAFLTVTLVTGFPAAGVYSVLVTPPLRSVLVLIRPNAS